MKRDLGPGEPADPTVGGGEDERAVGQRLDGEVEAARLDAGPGARRHPEGTELLGDVQHLDRRHAARRVLDVPERQARARDPDVRAVDPRPVVEPSGEPAPAERPPVAHPPGVVPLALALDGQRLVPDRHRASHQARDLVAGGNGVLVRHPVGGPGQVEPEGDRRPLLAPVHAVGTVEHAGRRRPVEAQPVEGGLDVAVHTEPVPREGEVLVGQRPVVGHRRDQRTIGPDDAWSSTT